MTRHAVVDKLEFACRLEGGTARCIAVAQRLVVESLPTDVRYILPVLDDPRGRRGPAGTLKYLGGRFIAREDLEHVDSKRAAGLLWVDGRVPAWINLAVVGLDDATTHVGIQICAQLVAADEEKLPRDLYADHDRPIEPFRVRGPALPKDWVSLEVSGRFSLRHRTVG